MAKLILAIDDDKYIHHIISETLTGFGHVMHAKDGDEGFAKAQKYIPDVIILDVEMPGLNGFEVCAKLKNDDKTKHIPVVFLSSKGELNHRLQGFEAGADDYIVKPFNSDELLARVKVMYQFLEQQKSLQDAFDDATETASSALSDSGDMGRIIRYVSQTYFCHDVDTLAQQILAFFEPLKLNVVVSIWYLGHPHFYDSEGAVTPLAQTLIKQGRAKARFVDEGTNTLINYDKVSLLIKNMPVDDDDLYGRYKDLFPHLLEPTDAKIMDMESEQLVKNEADQISATLDKTHAALAKQLVTLQEQLAEPEQNAELRAEQERILNALIKIDNYLVTAMNKRKELLLTMNIKQELSESSGQADDVELF